MILMQGCQISLCSVVEIFDDLASVRLFAEYERECANVVLGECAPTREMYQAIENAGIGQCFKVTVLDRATKPDLIGFAFVLLPVIPHYSRQCAKIESLYVLPEDRWTGAGLALMEAAEDYCRMRGFESVIYTAPVNSSLAKLLFLNAEEYVNTNHLFCRRLV